MIYLDSAATALSSHSSPYQQKNFFNVNANYATKEKQLFAKCQNDIKQNMGIKSGNIFFGGNTTQIVNNLVLLLKTME